MKNRKFIAIAIACVAFTSVMAGCDQISTTTEVTPTSASETVDSSSAESETSSDSNTGSDTYDSLDAVNDALGYTTYAIDSDAYKPVSYNIVNGDAAQITYNHDGNNAVLVISDKESDNLSGITGTENAENYKISDYDLDIDIQESDNKYVAEWSAVDKDGNKRYFALSEENVDLAVFENTLSSYAKTALASDQTTSNDNSDAETDENGETKAAEETDSDSESDGEVVATCEDNTQTYEYEIKEDGTYEFTDPVSDAETYWDIYVLDEQWEDGTRYIKQANDSKGQTPVTLDLKKGQWVYCFCSKDGFTSGEKIDCKLTITKK